MESPGFKNFVILSGVMTPEKCVRCSSIELYSKTHCRNCFCEDIEKRARKQIREYGCFEKGDKVLFVDNSSMNAAVAWKLFTTVCKGLPLQVEKKPKLENPESYKHIILSQDLDEEAEKFLDGIFDGKNFGEPKTLSILAQISQEEVLLYAKAKELLVQEREKTKLGKLLEEVESQYPGSKHALVKSAGALLESER